MPLVLLAMIASGAALAGNVRFSESGNALANCASVAVQPLAGSTAGAGVATCRIDAATAGSHRYVAQFAQLPEGGPATVSLDVAATQAIGVDYTDLWWGGAAQNGWGVNIAQQGRMLFVTWFSYGTNGDDTWFVVPGGSWTGAAFTGDLYATTSSPWLGTTYSPATFAPVKVGSMTLDFADQGFATMTYTVGGVTQSKTIVRQAY